MRGRKPTPTMLAQLHGDPSHGRKANPAEPKPVGNLDEPPDDFSDGQKAGWSYAIAHAPPGLLKRIDKAALAAFIVAEDLHRQANVQQQKVGLLWRPPGSDQPQQSPYLPIINRQALIMLKAISELGFSPVSRPRVHAGASLPPGPLANAATQDRVRKGGRRQPAPLSDYLATPPSRSPVH